MTHFRSDGQRLAAWGSLISNSLTASGIAVSALARLNGTLQSRLLELRRLATSHRHQPLFRLAELLCAFGDGLCFARRFNVADPNKLGAKGQDGPADEGFKIACQLETYR